MAPTATTLKKGLKLADLTDWLERLTQDGPALVIDSGAYGIQVVGSQAQDIFDSLEDLASLAPSTVVHPEDLGVAETLSAEWAAIRKAAEAWSAIDDLQELVSAVLGTNERGAAVGDGANALAQKVPAAIPLSESSDVRRMLNSARDFIHAWVGVGGNLPSGWFIGFGSIDGGDSDAKGQALQALNELQQLKLKIKLNTVSTRRKSSTVVVDGAAITAGGPADPLERQVARALSGALNRSAPTTPDSLVRALRETYPLARGGALTYRPGVERPSGAGGSADAFSGAYPPRQAILVRQAAVIATDALSVLAIARPTSVTADLEKFEDARRAIEAEIKALLEEFKHKGGPREPIALGYFEALRGDRDANDETYLPDRGHIGELIRAANRKRRPDTLAEERFEATATVVARYSGALRTAYEQYRQTARRSLGEITSDALQVLPIVGETNRAWQQAMNKAGVTASERELVLIAESSGSLDRILEDTHVIAEIDDLMVQLEQLSDLQAEVNELSLAGTGSV